ncbi:MAG: hypothetical protein HY906_04270 [Deltaproteobacteria bacterium]|nr:hypothetical protein [Deltaproteobacteria bacterium]
MDEATLIKEWLLGSGIQNRSGEPEAHGGFHSWYDLTTRRYPWIYSEATGYGITALLFLHERAPDPVLLERARLAADWIVRVALAPEGGVKARYYLQTTDDRYAFETGSLVAFDTGIVLFGLSQLYAVTGEAAYLRAGKATAGLLLRLQKPDGSLPADYDSRRGAPNADGARWSTQSGAFHAKVAMGLLALHRHTRDPALLAAARALCDHVVRSQQPDGRFVTTAQDGSTLQHPHCYAAEGLLWCGRELSVERYLAAAGRAVEWSLATQLPGGGIPQLVYGPAGVVIGHERSDILAQVLRLGACLQLAGAARARLERLRHRLLCFQVRDGEQRGGIEFGSDWDGTSHAHVNSWCSMFALQALTFHEQACRGEAPSLRHLV